MTTFHRYTTPAYRGGLPAGYDLINVVSGGTGAGGSAFADGQKSGGPNNNTYFVAFGENAQSNNANRGMRALAQNCDALDDYLHQDLAIAQRTTDVTAGSPVFSIVLPTDTYLGSSAYTTSTDDLARLYSVVDSNDEEIVDSTGTKVIVSTVTLGTGDQIGGGGANGVFSGNTVQLNLSPAIPTGTMYRVYYGSRSNLASLPSDALVTIKIRGAEEVSGPVEANFVALRGDGLAWNATWPTTIEELALGGLHQRYMRATTVSSGSTDIPPAAEIYWPTVTLDTPGSGGFFSRRGPALTGYANDAGPYVDPLNAVFAAKFFDHNASTSTNSTGAVGMAVYGARRAGVLWTGESVSHVPGAGAFAHLWPHYFSSSLSTSQPLSRIVNGTTALFSLVGAYNADSGEAIVQLTASNNYFRSGGFSAVNVGYDLLECVHTVGVATVTRTYVIVGHGSSATPTDVTKVRIRNLDGTVPDFTTPVTGTAKWISTTMWMGDGAAEYHAQAHTDVNPSLLSGFFYQVPLILSTGAGEDDIPRMPPSFSATDTGSSTALRWGGYNFFDSGSAPVWAGSLRGDGSATLQGTTTATGNIVATGSSNIQGAIKGNYVLTAIQSLGSQNTTGTTNWDASLGSWANLTSNVNSQLVTVNLTNVRIGGTYTFFLNYSTPGSGTFVGLIWAGAGLTHRFSPGDDQPLFGTGRSKWVGHAISATEIQWSVTHY